jgi:hypothetical protein
MLFAPRTRLSLQLFDELPPNHEPFELEGSHDDWWDPIDGSHEELLELIDGNQDDEPPELNEGSQDEELDDELEENIIEPTHTPTPRPMPNTASTVDSG